MVDFPAMPILNAIVSANAKEGLWQLAQLTEESFDNIFSEKSFLPNAAFVVISEMFSLKPALSSRIKASIEVIKNTILFIAAKLQMKNCREGFEA